MEILDLKLAGVTLWTWCGVIAFIWLIYRFGDLILNFLSIVWGLVSAAVLVVVAILAVLAVPAFIYDGEWWLALSLLGVFAFMAMLVMVDKIKYRPGSIGWHIYPRRRGPPTAPK
jgi:hypothetical protein